MKIKHAPIKCFLWSLVYGFEVAGLYSTKQKAFLHPKPKYHDHTFVHEEGHYLHHLYWPENFDLNDKIFREMVAILAEHAAGYDFIRYHGRPKFEIHYIASKAVELFLKHTPYCGKNMFDKDIRNMYDFYVKKIKPQLAKEVI